MERRKAVTVAAATSLTLLLGAAGLTANAVILGGHEAGGLGQLRPVAVDRPSATAPAATGVDLAPEIAPAVESTIAAAPTTMVDAPLPTPSPVPGAAVVGVDPAAVEAAPLASSPATVLATPAPRPSPTPAPAATTGASSSGTTVPRTTTGTSHDDKREPVEHEVETDDHEGAHDDD